MNGYGYRRFGGGVGGVLLWILWSLVKLLVKLLFRYIFGLPMDGKRRTDATFFQQGKERVGKLPDYFGAREPSAWSLLPGWQRAVTRLVPFAVAYAWWTYPRVTIFLLINAAAIAAVIGVVILVQRRRERHHLDVLEPLFAQMANYLGSDIDKEADPRQYLDLPRDWRTNRKAELVLTPPDSFDPEPKRLERLNAVVVRHLGTGWDVKPKQLETVWSRAPEPPRQVLYRELHPEQYDIDHMPIARAARDKDLVISMETDTPHVMVTGGSGKGKSAFLCLYITHVRTRATETQVGLVDYIDMKIASMKLLRGTPGVRIHTSIEAAVWCIYEFYVSQLAANMALDAGVIAEEDIPHRYLVIDEFSGLMSLIPGWWRRQGGKGVPPVSYAFLMSLMQGRSVQHRVATGVHSAKAGLFQGTEGRDLLEKRIYLGQFSRAKWTMAFGQAAKLEWDRSIAGRSAIGDGEGDPEEAQLAALDINPGNKFAAFEEGRRLILADGTPVPDWFSQSRLAPWITQEALDRAFHEMGIDTLDLRGTAPDASRNWPARTQGDVPHASPTDATPDYTLPMLPPVRERLALEELPTRREQLPPEKDAPAGQRPNLHVVRDNEEPVSGYSAAAAFLIEHGYRHVDRDAFKDAASKARRKGKPISNEWWDEDAGQWCWWPTDLLRWQHARRTAPKTKGA